jgi:membrane protein implicated in regulation of membrane protease activity
LLAHYWWWLLALALGIVEMLTGTFYLLVLAIGCAAGGVAAWLGVPTVWQLVVAALLSVVGWGLLHRWHPIRRRAGEATSDRDVLLDIGERVTVLAWDEQGRAQVSYRGANWAAELHPVAAGHQPVAGQYEIRGIVGNRLQLAPIG